MRPAFLWIARDREKVGDHHPPSAICDCLGFTSYTEYNVGDASEWSGR